MKNLLLLTVMLALTGCVGPWPWVKATAMPKSTDATPVANATINVHRTGVLDFFTGTDVPCEIKSIDGVPVDGNFRLPPGNHTLTVVLTHLGRECVGDVDLVIPEAKNYELKAKCKGDAFTLSLIDSEGEKIIATSTAVANDRMKFLVFVVQR